MANFKQETLDKLCQHFGQDYEVDEYRFCLTGEGTVEGRGDINWDKVESDLGLNPNFEYEEGFGGDDIRGFITVKNHGGWLKRAEYDGSSWWNYYVKPSLQ